MVKITKGEFKQLKKAYESIMGQKIQEANALKFLEKQTQAKKAELDLMSVQLKERKEEIKRLKENPPEKIVTQTKVVEVPTP